MTRTPERPRPPREGVGSLDGVQQRLYAVALGLRSLRSRPSGPALASELERLEAEVDDLIKDVRARAVRDRTDA